MFGACRVDSQSDKENLIIFEPVGTTKYSDLTCLHCFDIKEVHNFISPELYEETIEYIKELIEKLYLRRRQLRYRRT